MINNKSELAQNLWNTGSMGCPILDFHGHMHEYSAIYFPASSPEGMLKTMDRANVRMLMYCSHLALYDPTDDKKYHVDVVKKYPDRFRAYHSVLSRYTDPEKAIKEVEEYPDVYLGFKFLCDYYAVPLSSPVHDPFFKYLNDTKKICLIHTWGGSPYNGVDEIRKVVEKYPDVTYICGHSFFGDEDHAFDVFKDAENVYFELTAVPLMRGFVERIVQNIGSERMLFGTDLPWFSTFHGIGTVLSADITDEDRKNIFYKSGDKLLSRYSWYTPIDK